MNARATAGLRFPLCSLFTAAIDCLPYVKQEKCIACISALAKNAIISVGGEAWWVCSKKKKKFISEMQTTCGKWNLFLWRPDVSVPLNPIIRTVTRTFKGDFSSWDLDDPSWRRIAWREVVAKISTWLTVTCIRKLSLPTGFPWSQSFAELLSSPSGRVFDFYSGYEAGRFSFGASVQTRLQSVLRSSPCTPEHPRHPGSFQSKAQTKYIQRILWGFHPDADRLFFFLSQLRELLVDFKRFKWTKEEDDCLLHLTPAGRKARNFQGGIMRINTSVAAKGGMYCIFTIPHVSRTWRFCLCGSRIYCIYLEVDDAGGC